MPVEAEQKALIETQIAAVSETRKLNMKMHAFLHRSNRYIAQIEIDKEPLIKTGYIWLRAEHFMALVTMLTETHADRVAAEGKGARQLFGAEMEKMRTYRTILTLVVGHVIDKTNSEEVKSALKKIKHDHTNLDTLHDVLALASILNDNLDLVGDFTPGGIEVDDSYLEKVTGEVEELLTDEGKPNSATSERAMLVDRQEKLVTLCLDSLDEIKKYAKGAFFMDMSYYRKNYPLIQNNDSHDGDDLDDENNNEDSQLPSIEGSDSIGA